MDAKKKELINNSTPNIIGRILEVLFTIALVGGVVYGLFSIAQWTIMNWFEYEGQSIFKLDKPEIALFFIIWLPLTALLTTIGFLIANWLIASLGWLVLWAPMKYIATAEFPEYPFHGDDSFLQPTEELFDNILIDNVVWGFLWAFGDWRPAWQDELRFREEKRLEQDPDYQAAIKHLDEDLEKGNV